MSANVIPIRRYPNGEPYRLARGRFAPRPALEDRLESTPTVVDLDAERLAAAEPWIERIVRELRLRYYQPKTIKSYRIAMRGLLAHGGEGCWPLADAPPPPPPPMARPPPTRVCSGTPVIRGP